ncbi:MAG: MobA/MobL family protein [Opitutaceae bacterium]|nr:MobA/MobL family protein [Opitutaceae bacterium]
MATYHLSVKTISRSHGRSATGAAAYRTGARITDARTGLIHDYRRRRGVEASLLILPDDAPDWAGDRARLWNAAELAETRKNSTVAREFEIALPAELDPEQRQRLAADFARELILRHGCAADVAIHQPGREGDHRNHHAHILLTTRRLTAAGFGAKTRELDDLKTGEIGRWRERFAEVQNAWLREAGVEVRVDHRSLEAQEIDREATIHLGPTATALERRGVPTRLGESNREVQAGNVERQRDAEVQRAVERQAAEPKPQATVAEARAPAERVTIQSLRAKTARLYPTEVFPLPLEAGLADPPSSQSPQPEASAEAERRRRADAAARAQRQRDAERQALLSMDLPALERERSEWTGHRAWLARHEPPPATWLADQWGELARAKRAATAARQAFDELETAYADWRNAHRLALLLSAYLPGSQRRAASAWEQRLTEARAELDHARNALAVAQQGFDERLPAAEREARQMADEQRQQLAALQRRIEERGDLIQRAKVAQEAERERREAEARAQAEVERPPPPPVTIQSLRAETVRLARGGVFPAPLDEAGAESAPSGPPLQPEPPRSPETPRYVPVPRPKPKYPAPGG